MELLHQKTGMTLDEVDRTISVLCAKKYLEIRASASNVCFSLNGLFETDVARSERILDSSLFSVFEKEFGRTLSNQEMEKISDWNRTTDKKMIIYALREASAYQKLNVAYIDRILTTGHPTPQRPNINAFLNDLTQKLSKIQLSGISAISERKETEKEIILTITIPKP
jgi:DnaD/phage-associated family protein